MVAVFLLAPDEIINTVSAFTLVALVESEMTRALSVFSLRTVPYLSNNYDIQMLLSLNFQHICSKCLTSNACDLHCHDICGKITIRRHFGF